MTGGPGYVGWGLYASPATPGNAPWRSGFLWRNCHIASGFVWGRFSHIFKVLCSVTAAKNKTIHQGRLPFTFLVENFFSNCAEIVFVNNQDLWKAVSPLANWVRGKYSCLNGGRIFFILCSMWIFVDQLFTYICSFRGLMISISCLTQRDKFSSCCRQKESLISYLFSPGLRRRECVRL